MERQTETYALLPLSSYTMDARADFVARGLLVHTLGTLQGALLLRIEGSPAVVEHWIGENGGTCAERAVYPTTRARALLLAALDSYGSEALALAENARDLVGVDGIEEIAHGIADDGDLESAWTIRGALAALMGDQVPELGGVYEREAAEGFAFVAHGGAFGAWSTLGE